MLSTSPIEFEGQRDRAHPVPEGPAARSRLPRPPHQGQDQHRLHLHRQEGRQGEDLSISTTSATIRSATRRWARQAISYTTGVPAMIGAADAADRQVERSPASTTVEEFDPDPFLDALDRYGLPRSENHGPALGGLMSALPRMTAEYAGLSRRAGGAVRHSAAPRVYVVDEAAPAGTIVRMSGTAWQERTGCRVLLAQKAFSILRLSIPFIAEYLAGTDGQRPL